mgnify:CR=1 FL=1
MSILRHKKTYLAFVALLAIPLLVNVASAAKYKDRAPRYLFAFSATSLSDGRGNTIDIHGGGKITLMGGYGWGPFFWWWNVWIDGHGDITFVTDGNKESIKWKLGLTAFFVPLDGLYFVDHPIGTLNFTLNISGKLPNWVTEPIAVTLIKGSESTGSIIVYIGETSTYSGTGLVGIH